jgi:predicted DNA-binding transcriptional regulator YafY
MNTKQTQVMRQWKMIRLLADAPDGMTLKTLAESLQITTRTVNRDLAILQQAGLPLVENTGAHGIKFWQLSKKVLTEIKYDEAAALYLGRRFLAPLMHTFLWEPEEIFPPVS